jgi:hypothetical protein
MAVDKAGYKAERSYVLEKYGRRVETCHVADVKRSLGMTRGAAPNHAADGSIRKPCPADLWQAVEEAVRFVQASRQA